MADHVWTMANGEPTLISRMSDRHLLNTIRLLERTAQQVSNQTTYWDELNGCELADLAEAVHPCYPDLVAEARRRGLTWHPPGETQQRDVQKCSGSGNLWISPTGLRQKGQVPMEL